MLRLKGRNRVIAIALSATVAIGVVGAGTIVEAAPSGLQGPLSSVAARVLPTKGSHRPAARIAEKDILAASGLTQAQLKAGLQAGKSIGQTILANSGNPGAVEARVMAALKAKLDTAVTKNKITPDQETTALMRAQGQLDTLVNRIPKPAHLPPAKIASAGLADAAKVIGIQPADLRAAMKGGKSVAQVANGHLVSTQALIEGVTADVNARIDAALAAGKIDTAHAAKLKAGIEAAVTKLVNHVPRGKATTP